MHACDTHDGRQIDEDGSREGRSSVQFMKITIHNILDKSNIKIRKNSESVNLFVYFCLLEVLSFVLFQLNY